MFRGRVPGKGQPATENTRRSRTVSEKPSGDMARECDMEVIVSHESLLEDILKRKYPSPASAQRTCKLRAWRDENSGLWGLRRGRTHTTAAQFLTVFDTDYGMAAVRFKDNDCGIINDAGDVVWKNGDCQSMKFMRNRLLHITSHNKEYYVDMYSLRSYGQKPRVKRYGNVELLETDRVLYSRTKTVYINRQDTGKHFIHWRGFYLTIYDERAPFPSYHKEDFPSEYISGFACILEGDIENYYWLYHRLADGSIIITDNSGKYYHAMAGQPKVYVGCRDTENEWYRCRTGIEQMAKQAEEIGRAHV